ncbi:MAG: galactokinase family protein [Treponema porcinum]|nr:MULTISPECIES: galactokinase family protein [Treponema]MCI6322854.1 galactokinase [Treponema porcinum]MCI6722062.1 galactokinase [Treponema porcinum]MCI6815247.1 galactokinase [Treponema porcinum]MCI6984063.1 galactokinase [Treponema porcinum]MCI7080795.1 galactokinase [Treponema porcinum]
MKVVDDAHKAEYGIKPDVVAAAPGRFHLIGEHSWFFKDKTLSMAVNLPVYVALSKRTDSSFRFYFKQLDERKRANLNSLKLKKEDRWANAIKAVIYGFTSGGFDLDGGADITVYSDILPSAGFGITTAIKVAAALGIRRLFGLRCDDNAFLQVIERGNRLFLQQQNYNSDIFSAMFSKKDCLIVTDHTKNSYENVPVPFKDKKVLLIDLSVPRVSLWNEESLFEPENALLLGDMRESKSSVFGGWQYISDVTDVNEELSVVSEDTRRKLLCIMREHGDVLEAVKALEKNDFSRFARTVNHSYESLRDYYDLSCPEINWILKRVSEIEPNLESMREPVSCGRITGKGFGRCVYTVLREQDVDKFKEKLVEYEHIFGFHPSCYEVHSADGAHIVEG